MFRGYKLRQREVISVTTAQRLGYVSDVEINECTGTVEAIIVPGRRRIMRRLLGGGEMIIPWNAVEAVGDEIILVRISNVEPEKLT